MYSYSIKILCLIGWVNQLTIGYRLYVGLKQKQEWAKAESVNDHNDDMGEMAIGRNGLPECESFYASIFHSPFIGMHV